MSDPAITVSFAYRNHRGETQARTVDVIALEFLHEPGFGYQPGWFLRGFDHDKQAERSFALCNIVLPPRSSGLRPFARIVIDRLAQEAKDLHDEDQGNSGTLA